MVELKKLKPLLEDETLAKFLRHVLDEGELQQLQRLRIRQLEFALMQMETRRLTEIRRSLSGEAGGEENVRAAATILERAIAVLGPEAPGTSADDY